MFEIKLGKSTTIGNVTRTEFTATVVQTPPDGPTKLPKNPPPPTPRTPRFPI